MVWSFIWLLVPCFLPFFLSSADTYLLQIQPYNFSGAPHKPKTEGATIKADADQSDAGNVIAPATGQKEAVPQWYDVDVVKGTQFTVTGYNVATETPPTPAQATPTTAANGQEVCATFLILCMSADLHQFLYI